MSHDLSTRKAAAVVYPTRVPARRVNTSKVVVTHDGSKMDRVETSYIVDGRPVVMYIERSRIRWMSLAGLVSVILIPVGGFVLTIGIGLHALFVYASTPQGAGTFAMVLFALPFIGWGLRKTLFSRACGCPGVVVHCRGCGG